MLMKKRPSANLKMELVSEVEVVSKALKTCH